MRLRRIPRRRVRRRFSHRLSLRQRRGLALMLVCLLLMLLLLNFSRNLAPMMTEMAVREAYELITWAINDSINEKLHDGSLSYANLITLERDVGGGITALTTDMVTVNTLQTDITNSVIERVSNFNRADMRVPIGNIIGGNFLSGRGPGIGFRVVTLGNPSATFYNEFSSAGINQTKHHIMLDIAVTVSIMVPGDVAQETISTQVLVAETVIVGEVPHVFGQFGQFGQFRMDGADAGGALG